MTARSVLLAATPAASPTVPSMAALFGVASNSAVNAPVCVANAVFCHVAELVRHVPGGGGAVTVTLAVPLCPSLVAVIVAAPGATALFPLAHVITRPPRAFPLASCGVAVSCTVCPCGIVTAGGVTATAATGTLATVTDAVPLFPSLVAVIVAAPTATPRTMPLPSTLATPGALLPQVTARPLRGFPFGSSGVAANCIVAPTTTVPDGGVTATTATAVVL